MKIQAEPNLPSDPQQRVLKLTTLLRSIAQQVNALSEGRTAAAYNAQPQASFTPSGQNALGDFILNATPTETGAAGSKYLIHGWRCVTAGTPGTWLPVRSLTGN
jgi:hypothetical protein